MAGRRPDVARWLSRGVNAVSAILMALIAYAIWPEFVEAFETGEFFGTPGIFTAPWWPVKLAIFFSAVLCCLIWLAKVFGGDGATAEYDTRRSDA